MASARFRTGAAWAAFGSILRQASAFIGGLVLARLLTPDEFGVNAMVLTIVGFSQLLTESGLGVSLLRQREVSDRDYRFISGVQMLIALLLSVTLYFSIDWLNSQFGQINLRPYVHLICAIIVLNSLTQLPTTVLKRRLAIKSIQLAQVWSYLLGYFAVSLLMSLAGFGVLSLIYAQVMQSLLYLLFLYWQVGRLYSPTLQGNPEHLRFGLNILVTNLINWATLVADGIIMAKHYLASDLGNYNRLIFLAMAPAGVLSSTIGMTLVRYVVELPSREEVRQAFYRGYQVLCLLAFLEAAVLCSAPGLIIHGLYGGHWDGAVPMMVPVALIVTFQTIALPQGPILTALGRPQYETSLTFLNMCISLPLMFLAGPYSLSWLLASILLSRIFFFVLMSWALCRELEIPLLTYLKQIVRPAAFAAGFWLFLTLIGRVLNLLQMPATPGLVILGLIAGVTLFMIVVYRPQLTLDTAAIEYLEGATPLQKMRRLMRT